MVDVSTPIELVNYYASLLIMQYSGKPRAVATTKLLASIAALAPTSVKTVTFSAIPTAGTFTLTYNGQTTATLNWNDTQATIQTALQALTGLSAVTLVGAPSTGLITITCTGVPTPAPVLTVATNTLTASAVAVTISITAIDQIIPLAVQNGYNLVGTAPAVGKQLDVIGKYVGVSRQGAGTAQSITLSDADFLTLIRFGIITNTAQSDLGTIQTLLAQFFPNQVFVFDYQTMRMAYYISSAIGSQNLIQVLVSQGLLPRPMGVGLAVIYAPITNAFFSFRTYLLPVVNGTPLNSYTDYHTDRPWLSYANSVTIPA